MPLKYTVEEITVKLLLIAGVVLSLLQFLYNRSLWVDEAMLALNIIHKTGFELLNPLDYGQVAPILFLQIEKLFSILLPNTEYGLRIFPLLCYWAAIYFFYKIIKIQLHNVYAVIIALSFFVLNTLFVLYASEVKQYIIDVFVLTIIFYLIIKEYKSERNKYYALGIVGALSVFLSNVAPIILFTAGLYLLYTHFFVSKQKIVSLLVVFVTWLSFFSVYYYFFIYEHPTREFMVAYWSGLENAFLPYHSFGDCCKFISVKRAILLGALFPRFTLAAPIIQMILLPAFLAGILSLIIKKKWEILILTCTPPVLHLFLSAFQLYPFALRLVLYTLPCIIIICSTGFLFIIKLLFSRLKIKQYRFFILLLPISLFLFGYPFKEKKQEIKETIKYIQTNRNENENIYVHSSAFAASQYYETIDMPLSMIYIGSYSDQTIDDDEYISALKKLRGKNWLLFTYSPEDEKHITDQLDVCYKRLKTFHTTGSSAYLYDFGE
ncbi:MAG: glycosyltransferase family 39 protein [Prevotellaceae bacterium]|jgi:hypothetical protein|nr:glycosyltransferase family 39 protein [Prevotellaceae bacterium]